MNAKTATLTGEETIVGRIKSALSATGHHSLMELDVKVEADGATLLNGEVKSYYLRQLALSVTSKTLGVSGIEDQIEVA